MFYVQPWLDITEMGFATVVVTNDDPEKASEVAIDLANNAWSERHAFFETKLVPVDEAIAKALAQAEGPVILSDLADGNGAGSPGDATAVIAALLKAGPPKTSFANIRDPEAARACIDAGIGAEVDLTDRRQARQCLQPADPLHRRRRTSPAPHRIGSAEAVIPAWASIWDFARW